MNKLTTIIYITIYNKINHIEKLTMITNFLNLFGDLTGVAASK